MTNDKQSFGLTANGLLKNLRDQIGKRMIWKP